MQNRFGGLFAIAALALTASVSGVYATWTFSESTPQDQFAEFGVQFNEITFAPKETLQITAVQLASSSNASNLDVGFTHPTYLSSVINSQRTNGNVTYKVTVWNNTDVTYWYQGLDWEENYGNNALLGATNGITVTTRDSAGDSGNTFNTDDWVPPRTTRDFYVTYTFGSNALGSEITNVLSFQFGRRMDAVHDEFLAILNDTTSEYGYQYLTEVFEERYLETGDTVIANVGQDKEIFNALFGGEPTINIGGVQTPVTIMIQRENVDRRDTGDSYDASGAPTGCEYTLYITVDPLDSPTGEAMVYAVSYSRGGEGGAHGEWYQLGQLYEGTAPKTIYDDSGDLAFDITDWRATANEYEFIDGYTYKVGYEQGDQYAKYKTIEEIMSADDQNFFNAIDNSQLLRKVYAVVHTSENYVKSGYEGLRSAFENAAPFYNVYNNGQEVKIKRQATRAELLPYMVAIQSAYDYYNQVNGIH